MPELPEVQTTVRGILTKACGKSIVNVWTDYSSPLPRFKNTIKNRIHFAQLKKSTVGATIVSARRMGKYIIIDLSNGTHLIIHMKMTGHIMYGAYTHDPHKNEWRPTNTDPKHPLNDPFNKFIHCVLSLSDGNCLVLSDMRKFGVVIHTTTENLHKHIPQLGPDPLEKSFNAQTLHERLLLSPNKPIKAVLLDQEILAGVGNIYADESLWRASIHPLSSPKYITHDAIEKLHEALVSTLRKGIDFGGDSMSDYRNIDGERGKFQEHHRAYRKTRLPCELPNCTGTIKRITVGGRGTHFCSVHQTLYKK